MAACPTPPLWPTAHRLSIEGGAHAPQRALRGRGPVAPPGPSMFRRAAIMRSAGPAGDPLGRPKPLDIGCEAISRHVALVAEPDPAVGSVAERLVVGVAATAQRHPVADLQWLTVRPGHGHSTGDPQRAGLPVLLLEDRDRLRKVGLDRVAVTVEGVAVRAGGQPPMRPMTSERTSLSSVSGSISGIDLVRPMQKAAWTHRFPAFPRPVNRCVRTRSCVCASAGSARRRRRGRS